MHPGQTAPIGSVGSWSTLFVKDASKTFQQTIEQMIVGAVCAIRYSVIARTQYTRSKVIVGIKCSVETQQRHVLVWALLLL